MNSSVPPGPHLAGGVRAIWSGSSRCVVDSRGALASKSMSASGA